MPERLTSRGIQALFTVEDCEYLRSLHISLEPQLPAHPHSPLGLALASSGAAMVILWALYLVAVH